MKIVIVIITMTGWYSWQQYMESMEAGQVIMKNLLEEDKRDFNTYTLVVYYRIA